MREDLENRLRTAAAEASELDATDFRFDRKPRPTTSTIGWVRYSWTGIRRRCARCSRGVRSGVIRSGHEGRERELEFRVLCPRCYSDVMNLETPETWTP